MRGVPKEGRGSWVGGRGGGKLERVSYLYCVLRPIGPMLYGTTHGRSGIISLKPWGWIWELGWYTVLRRAFKTLACFWAGAYSGPG